MGNITKEHHVHALIVGSACDLIKKDGFITKLGWRTKRIPSENELNLLDTYLVNQKNPLPDVVLIGDIPSETSEDVADKVLADLMVIQEFHLGQQERLRDIYIMPYTGDQSKDEIITTILRNFRKEFAGKIGDYDEYHFYLVEPSGPYDKELVQINELVKIGRKHSMNENFHHRIES